MLVVDEKQHSSVVEVNSVAIVVVVVVETIEHW